MITKVLPSYQVRIYLSGPLGIIEQTCREECFEKGLCVTVEPTKFIYTGGEEIGAVVGLINYPRFPADEVAIFERASRLAKRLLDSAFQHSVLVVDNKQAMWITKRPEEKQ